MRKVLVIGAVISSMLLAACGSEPQYNGYDDVASYNQAPVVQQQDNHNDALIAGAIAGAAGYALGKSKGRKEERYTRPRTVYKTYNRSYYTPKRNFESRSSWNSRRSSYTGSSTFSSRPSRSSYSYRSSRRSK
jgi:hypothetical protein